MRRLSLLLLSLLVLAGCGRPKAPPTTESLPEARKGFQTKLSRQEKAGEPVAVPPADIFRVVRYDAPSGKLAAYLTPEGKDGKRRPAIIWITGGDCNTIGDVWGEAEPKNDQTASAYRKAGIVMMLPSLRGGNDNPGVKEGFLGEVDDVLAAAEYLAGQGHVDPRRIYLGGHSTGGTLVMLVAESSDRFRGVFSFGPVDDVRGYPPEYTPFDMSNPREAELRSPGRWLHSIKSPLFVFEGTKDGNIQSLREMSRASQNPLAHFYELNGADHFSILFPLNRLIAEKILRDDGETSNLSFTQEELNRALGR